MPNTKHAASFHTLGRGFLSAFSRHLQLRRRTPPGRSAPSTLLCTGLEPLEPRVLLSSSVVTNTRDNSSAVTVNPAAATATASASLSASLVNATTYQYTVTLNNTGSTNIGTFWFGWVPGEDFMPVMPTNITSPAGWTSTVTGGSSGDGYAIRWATTSAPLAAASNLSTFQFDSTATPAQLNATSPFYPGVPTMRSFVYIGAAFGDPGDQFDVAPAPLGSISGTAYNDANDNGARDTGETGLAGITINLQVAGSTLASTVTADDGSYSFANLAAGAYTIQEVVPSNDTLTQPTANNGAYSVSLAAGQSATADDFGNFASPAAPFTLPVGGAIKTLTYTQADGTKVSVSLKGLTAQLTFDGSGLGSTTNAKGLTTVTGSVDDIAVAIDPAATLPPTSALTFTTAKPAPSSHLPGNGIADVTSITGQTLTTLSAPMVDITGTGLSFSGYIGATTLHNLASTATISEPGNDPKGVSLTLVAIGGGATIDLGSHVNTFTAADWSGTGALTAPSIATLKITGNKAQSLAGNLGANITLSGVGAPKGVALNSLTVAGTLTDTQIISAGSIGTATLGAINQSNILVGMSPTFLASPAVLPTDPADYTNTTATITSLTVKGLAHATPSFTQSIIAGAILGTIKLQTVDTTNVTGSALFGIAADTSINSFSYLKSGKPLTLTKIKLPNDPRLAADFPDGDFEVTLA